MNIFNNIKNWFINAYYYFYLDIIELGSIQYKYLDIYKNTKLLKYIEKKALELCKSENLNVYNVLFDDLNNDLKITDEKSKAVGCFRYIQKDKIKASYYNLKNLIEKNNIDLNLFENREYAIPRIELTDKSDVFVLLHEIGHYFIYKRDQEQSEDAADAYCEEFFDNYLPGFFRWIFQIEIYVRTNKKVRYTSLESYNYLKEYKEWIKNNPDYF